MLTATPTTTVASASAVASAATLPIAVQSNSKAIIALQEQLENERRRHNTKFQEEARHSEMLAVKKGILFNETKALKAELAKCDAELESLKKQPAQSDIRVYKEYIRERDNCIRAYRVVKELEVKYLREVNDGAKDVVTRILDQIEMAEFNLIEL